MKKIYYLLLFSSVISFGQTQIGADINGEAVGDESGFKTSLSKDGSTVAVSAIKNDGNGTSSGHVRVYRLNGTNWTQIGSDLNGEAAMDQSGLGVSLSENGNIIAIGANGNDGSATESGHVRVYSFNGSVWSQLGADIDGLPLAENFSTCSISANGLTVAIGALNYNLAGNTYGRVAVYQFNGTQWLQIGGNILGDAGGDFLGSSVSLSNDGTKLAIGAIGNDANGSSSGQAKVFSYNGTNWIQIGSNINGVGVNDFSGDVSLSGDGNVLAVGARLNDGNGIDSGHVKLYTYNGLNWIQLGNTIYGEAAGDRLGFSVSLSLDGNILAAGASLNNGNGIKSGHTRIYKYNGTNWIQIGVDINGEAANDNSGFSVSISSNGAKVAIGALLNDGNGTDSGHVRVYDLSALLHSDTFVLDNFSIYPNPTSDFIKINLENNLTFEKVNIYNSLGQFIKSENNKTIEIKSLAKGNYFVEVITNQGKATKTIIIE